MRAREDGSLAILGSIPNRDLKRKKTKINKAKYSNIIGDDDYLVPEVPADVYFGVPTGQGDPKALWCLEQSMDIHAEGEVGAGHVERCHRDIVVDANWRGMVTPERIAGR